MADEKEGARRPYGGGVEGFSAHDIDEGLSIHREYLEQERARRQQAAAADRPASVTGGEPADGPADGRRGASGGWGLVRETPVGPEPRTASPLIRR
jgi:hypothetical protein